MARPAKLHRSRDVFGDGVTGEGGDIQESDMSLLRTDVDVPAQGQHDGNSIALSRNVVPLKSL
ncbi:MAG: hypothetical protein JWO42_3553 [Chloroflexi bacterium]|nr:hypothetical protein [Chloroflexota bacterium]